MAAANNLQALPHLTLQPQVTYAAFKATIDGLAYDERVEDYVATFEALGMEYCQAHAQSFRFAGGTKNIKKLLTILLYLCLHVVDGTLPAAALQQVQAVMPNAIRHLIARTFQAAYTNQIMLWSDWHVPLLYVLRTQMPFFVHYLAMPIARTRLRQPVLVELLALFPVQQPQANLPPHGQPQPAQQVQPPQPAQQVQQPLQQFMNAAGIYPGLSAQQRLDIAAWANGLQAGGRVNRHFICYQTTDLTELFRLCYSRCP